MIYKRNVTNEELDDLIINNGVYRKYKQSVKLFDDLIDVYTFLETDAFYDANMQIQALYLIRDSGQIDNAQDLLTFDESLYLGKNIQIYDTKPNPPHDVWLTNVKVTAISDKHALYRRMDNGEHGHVHVHHIYKILYT